MTLTSFPVYIFITIEKGQWRPKRCEDKYFFYILVLFSGIKILTVQISSAIVLVNQIIIYYFSTMLISIFNFQSTFCMCYVLLLCTNATCYNSFITSAEPKAHISYMYVNGPSFVVVHRRLLSSSVHNFK